MTDEVTNLQMYLATGFDTSGDPIKALVVAGSRGEANRKVREDFDGTVRYLKTEPITGNQWDEHLKGYGSKYGGGGPYPPERTKDFPGRASRIGVAEGRPIFL